MNNYTRYLFLILFFASNVKSQITNHVFSQYFGSYNMTQSMSVLGSGASLSNQTYQVSLPFPFKITGSTFSDIYVSVNGYITFGTNNPGTSFYKVANNGTGFYGISAFDTDLAGLNSSTEVG
jgi:hypothetical protein